jgi:hypothetical protein
MRPNQLLQAIGAELRMQIMTYLQTEQRAAYKAVIESLAPAKRLRPAFILEKSRAKQAEWLLEQLNTKSNEEVTAQIFQIWLLKGQAQMLITFLDAAGIAHDGKGEVTELPEVIADRQGRGRRDRLARRLSLPNRPRCIFTCSSSSAQAAGIRSPRPSRPALS